MVEQLPAVLYAADLAAATWHYVSPLIQELLGYSAEEWQADTSLWIATSTPTIASRCSPTRNSTAIARSGPRSVSEYLMRPGTVARSGSATRVSSLPARKASRLLYRSFMIDISAQKESRARAPRQRGADALTLDSASQAYIAIDAQGRIIDWNAQAEATFGWSRKEALGEPLEDWIIPMASARDSPCGAGALPGHRRGPPPRQADRGHRAAPRRPRVPGGADHLARGKRRGHPLQRAGARHHPAQGAREAAPAPGLPRLAHRPRQPRALPRSRRARPGPAGSQPRARCRSSSPTSTTSRPSTTRWATRPATSCSWRSPSACGRCCARGHDRPLRRRRVRDPAEETDEEGTRRAAERILEALRSPFEFHGRQVVMRASIGVAFTTDGSTEPDDLLRQADLAMYTAKTSARAASPSTSRRCTRPR